MIGVKELQALLESDGCSFLPGYVRPDEDQRWLPKMICLCHDLLWVLAAHGYPGVTRKYADRWMYETLVLGGMPIRAWLADWIIRTFGDRRWRRAKQATLKPEMIKAAAELGLLPKT